MLKIPENIGVYLSTLYISICRGDIPSAKLAYRYISSCDKAAFYFKDVLAKASLFHFSILPIEVIEVTPQTAWGIISGMCRSPLDKRALALSILEINGRTSSRASWEFSRWLKSNKTTAISPQPLQKRLTQDAVRFLNRSAYLEEEEYIDDVSFFSYKSEEITKVENINNISPMYYLGDWSWMRKPIESSLSIINNMVDIDNIIDIFEVNRAGNNIQFGQEYWEFAKCSVFGDEAVVKRMEELWEITLKPAAMKLITTLQLHRIPMSG